MTTQPLPRATGLDRALRLAGADLALAFTGWRIWYTLAWNDIAQRYRRSVIGPFWLTLSTAIFVGALGLLYSSLLHISVNAYLPYLAIGYVLWGMLSSFLLEAGQCFISAEGYLKQMPLSKLGLVFRMILRNFIIFLHNIAVIVAVMVIFRVAPGPQSWLIVPALLLNLWFGTAVALLLGMICTRFRDLQQIMINLVSVMLFMTPVFWNPRSASAGLVALSHANPLASFIATFRDPLLGLSVNGFDWMVAALSCVAMTLVTSLCFICFRSRIPYWL